MDEVPVEYCQYLISTFHADPNYVLNNTAQTSCLMFASGLTNTGKVILLLENGATPDYQSPTTKDTALFNAIMKNRGRNVEELIKYGADPYAVILPDTGKNILQFAQEEDVEKGTTYYQQLEEGYKNNTMTTVLQMEQQFLAKDQVFSHHFENMQSFYEFLNGPLPEEAVEEAQPEQKWEVNYEQLQNFGLGGSSRKTRRKSNKKRKTNKKRRTNKKQRTNRRK
jgi:hypothetical protein